MINFMKLRWFYFALSLLVLIPGVISLATKGLKLSIDFTGGSLIELRSEKPIVAEQDKLQQIVGDSFSIQGLQVNEQNTLVLKGTELTNEQKDQVIQSLENEYGSIQTLRFERVGATISKELLSKTITGIVIVASAIMLFVTRQFKEWRFGVAAILAMLHDTLVLLGIFSILGALRGVQVDVLFVTALLTTLSFSVHDTIVVFDRIRELRRKFSTEPFVNLLNTAITQTLTRSLNNSITIIITLLALVLLGGSTIHFFALALLIGAVTGTYSSTFTAVPLLLLLGSKRR